ncbi:MAG: hypothetical protein BroJett029_23620 [Alphaproteobacteria bacterium]|nr:MAG: hypothetical protein BroJett029_23620 [Alphaproteobacteria bacterium]
METGPVGFLAKLLRSRKPAESAKPSQGDLATQREALAGRLMTPERAALIAHALEVQRSKQQVFKELAEKVGQERMAEMIRRMMEQR